jgi:ketosteroid isomerase-like protein
MIAYSSLLLLAHLLLPYSATSFTTRTTLQKGFRTWKSNADKSRQANLFMANGNVLESLTSLFSPRAPGNEPSEASSQNSATKFLEALNHCDIDTALSLVSEDCVWDDRSFYKPCEGKEDMERRLRLQSECSNFQTESFVVDDCVVDDVRNTVGVLFHKENADGADVANGRGCALFELEPSTTKLIAKVCIVCEPPTKGGENGLKILAGAGKFMQVTGFNPEAGATQNEKSPLSTSEATGLGNLSPPEQYFAAWNRRDIAMATQIFSNDVVYEDTAFASPFAGKESLSAHLNLCAEAFPATFTFELDCLAADKSKVAVKWHVENDGEPLPYTQGCSFYKLDEASKIQEGIDLVEPSVIKPAGAQLFLDSFLTKLSQEPLRWIPAASWVAYMYIVFFSDGILPGANALQLEQRTWEEVFNLSLNFFLVSPILHLPFSPSVHPMLEGVFNLLLSWAAMFAGFLSDDRRQKPNLLPFFPIVVGMQFLTSAFLLPYLATRSTEPSGQGPVSQEELPAVARVAGESRVLGALMGLVGSGSILWFFLGRMEEYGTEFAVRYASFVDLLSIDRVGSSFIVDLVIFALFQGWLVDDDQKRRGVQVGGPLEKAAKYIPFFGLVAYLSLRAPLPETSTDRNSVP